MQQQRLQTVSHPERGRQERFEYATVPLPVLPLIGDGQYGHEVKLSLRSLFTQIGLDHAMAT